MPTRKPKHLSTHKPHVLWYKIDGQDAQWLGTTKPIEKATAASGSRQR